MNFHIFFCAADVEIWQFFPSDTDPPGECFLPPTACSLVAWVLPTDKNFFSFENYLLALFVSSLKSFCFCPDLHCLGTRLLEFVVHMKQ